MADKLTELARHTVIVADTGDITQIKAVGAQDCTTNPSLILKAASKPEYAALVDDAVAYGSALEDTPVGRRDLALDKLAINFGKELSRIVPGHVSTEVDARPSFDTAATVKRAARLVAIYREAGVGPKRILPRHPATRELSCLLGLRLGGIGGGSSTAAAMHLTQGVPAAAPRGIGVASANLCLSGWQKRQKVPVLNPD